MLNGLFARYINFRGNWKSKLYKRQGTTLNSKYHKSTLFTEIQRVKLTKAITETELEFKGANLNLASLTLKGFSNIKAFFPLHDMYNKEKLLKVCTQSWTIVFHPPIEEIREYFGEQVALYFEFLSFYSRYLIPVSILGTIVTGWQIIAQNVDIWGTMPFGFIMLIWSTVFLEHWKQREALLRTQWGTHRLLENEPTRCDFQGPIKPCPITAKKKTTIFKEGKMQKTFV